MHLNSATFPTGSFCKTGFSVLGKVKPGFRVRFRFWKSRYCVRCKSAWGGVTSSNIINRTVYSSRSAAAASAPLISRQDRCHDYWKAVYERTRARRRPQVPPHHQSSALPRHERPGSASRLPVSSYRQAVERGLRLVGLYDGRRYCNRIEAVVLWMGQQQRSSWRTLMTCSSAEFRTPPTTFYMNCCRTQARKTTNSGPGAIINQSIIYL